MSTSISLGISSRPDLVVLRANSRSRSAGDIEVVHEERSMAHVHCNWTSPSFDDNRRQVVEVPCCLSFEGPPDLLKNSKVVNAL